MKLIFIYGPPASGKLTIAKELSQATGFKLFHNHLTQDLAGTIYPEWNDQRYKLVEKLRLDVFEYVAQQGTDIIYTQYYTGDNDDIQFVKDAVETVNKQGGSVVFIEIVADVKDLQERVTNESRKSFGKAQDIETLQKHLNASVAVSVEYPKIIIDSSKIDPATAAQMIVDSIR